MKQGRLVFVDLFRFTAVFLMVQGHTFDAYLSLEMKEMGWYEVHRFIHGFTAPMFLFSSGLAFGIATFRKWEQHIHLTNAVWKRYRRYLMLLIIGYALHLPYDSLSQTLADTTPERWSLFFKVDALQIIGVTLIVAQALVFVAKRKHIYISLIIIISTIIWFLTPYFWSANLSSIFELFSAYLNRNTGSYFPIFPWAIYLFSGISIAYLFLNWNEVLDNRRITNRFMILGFILTTIGYAGMYDFINLFVLNNYIIFSVLARTGILILFLVGLFYLDFLFIAKKKGQFGRPLQSIILMGQETLSIYIVHLLIVYGSVINRRFISLFGNNLSLFESSLFAVLLMIGMGLFAWMWHYLKKERAILFQRIIYIGSTVLLLLFFLR